MNNSNYTGRRILVTGGTGFIGRHLVAELLDQGAQVRVLMRAGTPQPLSWSDRVALCYGDLEDTESLARACCSVDTVFHTAGFAHVPVQVANRLAFPAINPECFMPRLPAEASVYLCLCYPKNTFFEPCHICYCGSTLLKPFSSGSGTKPLASISTAESSTNILAFLRPTRIALLGRHMLSHCMTDVRVFDSAIAGSRNEETDS